MKNNTFELRIPKEQNPYYKNNQTYFDELLDGMLCNRKRFTAQLTRSKQYILDWINCQLPQLNRLDYKHKLVTKVFWIIHGITDFHTCMNDKCSKELIFHDASGLNKDRHPKYCSVHCQLTSNIFKKERTATWQKKLWRRYYITVLVRVSQKEILG